jgi:hypothetical protein
VHVCAGGVFGKGPVDQVHLVSVKAQKSYFDSADPKERTIPCGFWPEARGSTSRYIVAGI